MNVLVVLPNLVAGNFTFTGQTGENATVCAMSLGTEVTSTVVSVDLPGRVLGFATTVPVVDGIDVIVNVDDIPIVVDGILAGGGLGIVSCTIKKECWLLSGSESLNLATCNIGSSSELLLKGGVGQLYTGESAQYSMQMAQDRTLWMHHYIPMFHIPETMV